MDLVFHGQSAKVSYLKYFATEKHFVVLYNINSFYIQTHVLLKYPNKTYDFLISKLSIGSVI